jgi:hypothetical protein
MKSPQSLEGFPDISLGDAACVDAVLKVYSRAKPTEAFEAAAEEWRRRNRAAAPFAAPIAVARILRKQD